MIQPEYFWLKLHYRSLFFLFFGEIACSFGLLIESVFIQHILLLGSGIILISVIGLSLWCATYSFPMTLAPCYIWQKKTILWHGFWVLLQLLVGVFFIFHFIHYFLMGVTYFLSQIFIFIFTLGLIQPKPIETFFPQAADSFLFFQQHIEIMLILALFLYPLWIIITQGWFLYRLLKARKLWQGINVT